MYPVAGVSVLITSLTTQVFPPDVVALLSVYSVVKNPPEPLSRPTNNRAQTVNPPIEIPATTGLVIVVPSCEII
jgi:hypothetical protein